MIPLFSVLHPHSLIMNLTQSYKEWDSRVYVYVWKMACFGSCSCTSDFKYQRVKIGEKLFSNYNSTKLNVAIL